MNRRAFLAALLFACGCGEEKSPSNAKDPSRTTPAAIEASDGTARRVAGMEPQRTIPRVAILVFGSRGSGAVIAASGLKLASGPKLIRDRLGELGYVDGESILLSESYADGDPRRLAQLAHEIVESKPNVIVAIAAAATAAARQATRTIPIVMAHAGNPVGSGMAASLAHPAGNVTGTTSMIPDLGRKQVELLRELIPGLGRLGVLANPTNAGAPALLENVNDAARRANISVVVGEVARAEDFDKAFDLLRGAHLDALFVMVEPLIGLHRSRVLDFAATNRLPASYDVGTEFVREGGLMSYGPVLTSHYALVADYVDKILKGAKPGDLPVQQPTQFALTINLKAAKALGVTVPQSLLLRASEVIE